MEKPRVTEQHRQLEKLAGSWTGDERVHAPPYPSEGTARATWKANIGLDGLFLIADYTEELDGKPFMRGHGVFGWDPKQGVYTLTWFDSLSPVPPPPMRGTWTGDTLTLEGEAGGHKSRLTYTVNQEGLRMKAEGSADGKSWRAITEGSYRRA